HTRSKRDWSSDVCSSDLGGGRWRPRNMWRTRSPQNLGGRVFVGRGDSSPECITAAFHGIVAAMSGECASTTIWAVSGAYAAEHEIGRASCRGSGWSEVTL